MNAVIETEHVVAGLALDANGNLASSVMGLVNNAQLTAARR